MLRNKAKKPISKIEKYLKYGFVVMEHECHYCPRCGKLLNAGSCYKPKYCSECGQKISFDGIEWKNEGRLGYAERRVNLEQIENRVV